MARLLDADDLIAELEASCMPIHEKGISGIPGDNSSIADIINSLHSEKEKEPAPAATGTSSEVSKDTGSILQFDDSTKEQICQVLASAMSTLLALYQEMEPHEKKAFDLGETYKDICCASAWMNSVRKGGDGNGQEI